MVAVGEAEEQMGSAEVQGQAKSQRTNPTTLKLKMSSMRSKQTEVAAANVVLNLLADEKKRGRLRFVWLPRVLLLRCNDWVERLGGKEEVDERRYDPVWIGHFDGNLRMP